MTKRSEIINHAISWIGCKESNGTHKQIIDVYNNDKPLPRSYKVKYTDAWCATFVSACAIKCNAKDIIPKECSCSKMITLFKNLGSWMETDSYKPLPGDIIFYDWDDNGSGENQGNPEHVGIVEKVSGSTITVIEGNYSNAVKRRTLQVNGKYIRGYGLPKYAEEVEEYVMIRLDILKQGTKGEQVKTLQRLLMALGYEMKNGKKTYKDDGSFGPATKSAVINFQKAEGIAATGVVDEATWNRLLK